MIDSNKIVCKSLVEVEVQGQYVIERRSNSVSATVADTKFR